MKPEQVQRKNLRSNCQMLALLVRKTEQLRMIVVRVELHFRGVKDVTYRSKKIPCGCKLPSLEKR